VSIAHDFLDQDTQVFHAHETRCLTRADNFLYYRKKNESFNYNSICEDTFVYLLYYLLFIGTWCVTEFNKVMTIYNQINIVTHYTVPFLINVVCTVVLIVEIVHRRARIEKTKTCGQVVREQLIRQKELFIPPLAIIASALPQLIISFSFACMELDNAWQRYMLTVSYFVSYFPQTLSFFLYIQPSTFYKSEFHLTHIGKILNNGRNKRTI
jgi:hypothetical protein